MERLYPNGYSGSPQGTGSMLPMEQVEARTTVQRLHPEFWRRVKRMMEYANAAGVVLGVGTGWRVQPSGRPGFAEPGNSYHEGFMPNGTSRPNGVDDRNAMAADMVIDQAWGWMGANCHRFGLVDFSDVNDEPWHVQPVEIPRSRNFATRMPALNVFPLPPSPFEGEFTVTPQDDAAIREIIREQTPKNCRAQTAAAVNKFQALVNANPTNAIYKSALAQEQSRLAEWDAVIAMPANVTRIIGEVDTVEEQAAALQAAIANVNLTPIVNAVVQAIKDNPVSATLSDEDIDNIAQSSAQAVIAEIAS